MNNIRILSEKVASQIAAGEVIERPASIVRELLDNSIDAQADNITVKIERGGKKGIRVTDNGSGMGRDDLLLCIERHATSKIHTLSDLFTVGTLGFRGEALPSIASVSRLEIASRPGDELIGHRLSVEGGRLVSVDETGAPPGTIVTVRDLFYNTPARRKFLRTDKTETNHIVDTFSRIALPYIHIHFKLLVDDKTVLNLPASNETINRLAVLMGRHVVKGMIETRAETEGAGLWAHLGSPETTRRRGDRIYIYVNGRQIRDRLVTRALLEGYGQRLMKGQYPQVALFLDMDPSLVDINVHPTKQEVRFHQGRRMYQWILNAVDRALGDAFHTFIEPVRSKVDRAGRDVHISEPLWSYSPSVSVEQPESVQAEQPESVQTDGLFQARERSQPGFQIIGQLKNAYILCQTEEGLLLVDQHAAHERIVYETLRQSFRKTVPEVQPFLIPQKIELSLQERQVVEAHLETLGGLGLEIEHFGGNTFLLKAIPAVLMNASWDKYLAEVVQAIQDGANPSTEDGMDTMLTLMACHGAIRAGTRMSHEEMFRLLQQMDAMAIPTNCPHGRPIYRKITYYEIEKMFKRVI